MALPFYDKEISENFQEGHAPEKVRNLDQRSVAQGDRARSHQDPSGVSEGFARSRLAPVPYFASRCFIAH